MEIPINAYCCPKPSLITSIILNGGKNNTTAKIILENLNRNKLIIPKYPVIRIKYLVKDSDEMAEKCNILLKNCPIRGMKVPPRFTPQ